MGIHTKLTILYRPIVTKYERNNNSNDNNHNFNKRSNNIMFVGSRTLGFDV